MSHIVTIKTEVRDIAAVEAACRRLGLPAPRHGNATVFRRKVSGVLVQLPDWEYPVVCKLETGEVLYDNYEGEWGNEKHLNRFLQSYAVEKASLEARRHGYSVYEVPLEDGSIQLHLTGS